MTPQPASSILRGAPKEPQVWVSAFTNAIIGVLQRGRIATYRDLLDETARAMRAQIPPRTRQTPGRDGDALDRTLLGVRSMVPSGLDVPDLMQAATAVTPAACAGFGQTDCG